MPLVKPTIHALLVGVNEYKRDPNATEPRDLSGCVNDVNNMEVLLSAFSDKRDIETKILLNKRASYHAVIQGFREHLSKAKAGDTALFYYSGHGTRETQTPDEFLQFFSTHHTENLVCYDGCTQAGLTLADKELAVLISEIPEVVHVVVILDACHSGSGTRGDNERMTDPFNKKRTLDQYLDGWFSERLDEDKAIKLPHRKHILLAAADRRQKARERVLEGEMVGVFSYFLRKAVAADLNSDSYMHIMGHVGGLLRVNNYRQVPQLEPLGGASVYDRFLLGEYAGDAQFSRVFYKKGVHTPSGSWNVALGAIHGIHVDPMKDQKIPIFADPSGQEHAGFAYISKLGLQVSRLKLASGTSLSSNRYYWTWMSARPLHVYISAADQAMLHLEINETHSHGSLIQFSHDGVDSWTYRLYKEGDYWNIYERERLLCGAKGKDATVFIYNQLLTIAKQESLLTLNSPATSRLDREDLSLRIEAGDDALIPSTKEGVDYHCKVRATRRGYTQIPYQILASHAFDSEVYFALYVLNADFSIHALNIDQDLRKKGHEVSLYNNFLTSVATAPKAIYSEFILIASHDPIQAGTLEQMGIPFKALWGRVDLDSPSPDDTGLRDRGLRIRNARMGQQKGDTAVNWVLKRLRVEIEKE